MSAKTVYVGMSGGVDSSLSAALLLEQGYKVVGVYMKNWTQDIPGFICPWKEDFQDAKRVTVRLGIDLKVFDFEEQYRQKVVDYMIDEYKIGRTPNPDIMCNQEIKFKLFLEAALEQGADMIATGHYARVTHGGDGTGSLHVAANKIKDQTYFLYRVSEQALGKTLFPIGDFTTKADVRARAHDFNLPTADKKDSQGICFVGKVGIKEFLKQYVTAKPGPIIDSHSQTIGQHDGVIFYTIGQRHGLDVGGGLPYYVTHKDMALNTVYVTADLQDASLWSHAVTLRSVHWINKAPLDQTYQVRLRYRGPLIKCTILVTADSAIIELADQQRAVAAGQSAVVYDGDRVIGGGIISAVA
ncbi:MAG: tRNA 2-thiouridine(34) synthase MnmA [Candidatus Saccharimonadales bacterium]